VVRHDDRDGKAGLEVGLLEIRVDGPGVGGLELGVGINLAVGRVDRAVQAGAVGYLLKDAPRKDIFNAIRVVMEGGSLLQPVVASKLLRHMEQQHFLPHEMLTERELEVLSLLAQGMPNKAIAAQLVISERTAKFHVSSIMGKLGATNRTEAVSLAAQKGLITLHS